jgi:3-oxoacyl-[acyl-carrier protein] reductase
MRLARAGADVVVHDLNLTAASEFGEAETAMTTVEDIRALGRRSLLVLGDLTSADETEVAVQAVLAEMRQIDLLVNCAGGDIAAKGGKPKPNDLFIQEEDLRAVMDRNLMTTMNACRSIVPSMLERQTGRIVNISSVAGLWGNQTEVAYSVAKAGVLHYTRCLAKSLREAGITVNAICPGPTKSARFLATLKDRNAEQVVTLSGRLTRLGEPDDIAKAVEFFASDLADYITGQVLRVDGGWGGFPA